MIQRQGSPTPAYPGDTKDAAENTKKVPTKANPRGSNLRSSFSSVTPRTPSSTRASLRPPEGLHRLSGVPPPPRPRRRSVRLLVAPGSAPALVGSRTLGCLSSRRTSLPLPPAAPLLPTGAARGAPSPPGAPHLGAASQGPTSARHSMPARKTSSLPPGQQRPSWRPRAPVVVPSPPSSAAETAALPGARSSSCQPSV